MAIRNAVLINAALESGLISAEVVAKLKVEARRNRADLLDTISFHSRLPVAALYQGYAELHKIPFLGSRQLKPNQEILRKLPTSFMQRRNMIPLSETENEVVIVVDNPEDTSGIEQAKRIFNKEVMVKMASPDVIKTTLHRLLSASRQSSELSAADNISEFDSVASLNEILKQAYLSRGSDIHFEPQKEDFTIRIRVDGRLQDYSQCFSVMQGNSLMSRMKVLMGMDIAEQRAAQDGGMTHTLEDGTEFDIRAATVPTRWGERATLRLLGTDSKELTLAQIGMNEETLNQFTQAINSPYGMILITGPTGSGKSTTLYSALTEIADPELNIMTVEDPVEITMRGIAQVQVNSKVSFAGALRSFLRHDPDVIMVGEIRDSETADVALKAAMTGHLVFSTLHTNNAVSAIARLVDIGAERFLVSSTLLAIIAQRLLRRLCSHCCESKLATVEERRFLKLSDQEVHVHHPVGCANCLGTGYRGRIGVFESLWVDSDVARLIAEGVSESELTSKAKHYSTLWEDGQKKVLAGLISLSELQRIVTMSY
ncbi:MAG: GspE/PulE family protein [Pseudomonadales bacterium]|nr:GspE/PulE family protein [Pseudomonadales bacterium]